MSYFEAPRLQTSSSSKAVSGRKCGVDAILRTTSISPTFEHFFVIPASNSDNPLSSFVQPAVMEMNPPATHAGHNKVYMAASNHGLSKTRTEKSSAGGRGVVKSSTISLNSTMLSNNNNANFPVLRHVKSPSMSPLTVGSAKASQQPLLLANKHQSRIGNNNQNRESPLLCQVKSPQSVADELEGRGRRCDSLLRDDPPLSSTLPPENNNSLFAGELSPFIMGEERSNGAMALEENSNDASSVFSGISRGAWEANTFGLLGPMEDTMQGPPTHHHPNPLPIQMLPPHHQQQGSAKDVMISPPTNQRKPAKQKRKGSTQRLNSSSSSSSSNTSAITTASSLACKLELESILSASANDPSIANKTVAAVLAEAGVGAEFHAMGRLKSLRYNRFNGGQGTAIEAQRDLVVAASAAAKSKSLSNRASQLVNQSPSSEPTANIKSGSTRKAGNKQPKAVIRPSSTEGSCGSTQKMIPCSYKGCEKIFATKGSMRKHLQIHGPRQHTCNICQRSFIERSKLKRHLLVHSGEKPYVCNFPDCGKKFSLDFNLRTHIRSIHTQERPFMCSVCNKCFSQSANLRVHSVLHKKEKSAEAMKEAKRVRRMAAGNKEARVGRAGQSQQAT